MKKTEAAFKWIVNILNEHQIPFQIAGGFAARLYGSTRELADIDIDIPAGRIEDIQEDVKEYIIFGPEMYKDENWDLLLMTLRYEGQDIDISSIDTVKIFNQNTQNWEDGALDFQDTRIHTVFGLDVPVISRENLIKYKSKLLREVDKLDIEEISK